MLLPWEAVWRQKVSFEAALDTAQTIHACAGHPLRMLVAGSIAGKRPPSSHPSSRSRDIFPLPFIDASDLPRRGPDRWARAVVDIANGGLAALRKLHGVCSRSCVATPTQAQRRVHQTFVDKAVRLLLRLADVAYPASGPAALSALAHEQPRDPCETSTKLQASAFDLLGLGCSAGVDPLPYLPCELKRHLKSPSALFRELPAAAAPFPGIRDRDRQEYARLVRRQLEAEKVELMTTIRAGGTIFAVGKRDSSKLREVWHGAYTSSLARRPPRPQHLAAPSALVDLESSESRPIRVTKRDGRCLFDQLRLPPELRCWMGRPPLRVRELIQHAGMSLDGVRKSCKSEHQVFGHTLVFPVSRCWPMGFSWSSCVAQATMLHICRGAGLRHEGILTDDRPTPSDVSSVHALATDDIMHFTRLGEEHARQVGHKIDVSMAKHGVIKHEAKDVTGELSATVLGIDVEDGLRLASGRARLSSVLAALCELIQRRSASPLGLAAVLGQIQWFDQLARPLFSILDETYTFARRSRPKTMQALPIQCVQELKLVAALALCWEADLTRPWLEELTATDASVDFGFGVCACPCTADEARRVGRLAEKRGDYIRLDRGYQDDEAERPRIGTPHSLHLRKQNFRVVISAKKKYSDHSGALEATAIVMLLRWLLRSSRKHHARVVALVDAKAVLGAAAKGRTSARTLKAALRKVAALTLAGDFLMRYVYVPTEDNPADAPSRGLQRRWVARPHTNVT